MLKEVLIRSISGFVFLIPGIILFLIYLSKTGKKQTPHHIIGVFVFSYYLIGVLTMVGISSFKAFSPRIVLIPFVDMISGPIDTVLNILLFLPLGFFLALLYGKYRNIGRIVLLGFLLSMAIELLQMFGMGTTDINDLLTNTAGACFGYLIYFLLSKVVPKEFLEKFHACNMNEHIEILLLIAFSFIIMVTIQPYIIRTVFRLG